MLIRAPDRKSHKHRVLGRVEENLSRRRIIKWRIALVFVCCLCLVLGAVVVLADSMKIKDIIDENAKIRDQELSLSSSDEKKATDMQKKTK
jgi:cell division septal protein FtsQ